MSHERCWNGSGVSEEEEEEKEEEEEVLVRDWSGIRLD